MSAGRTWIPPVELDAEPSPPVSAGVRPVLISVSAQSLKTPPQPLVTNKHQHHPGKPQKRQLTLWQWFAWPAVLVLMGVIGEEMVTFLLNQYRIHPTMGIIFALLLSLSMGALMLAVRREFNSMRAIKKQNLFCYQAEQLIQADSFGSAMPLLSQVSEIYENYPEMQPVLTQFHLVAQPHLSDKELLSLFSSLSLRPLDEAALRIIGRHAASAALFAVISPLAILDALVFFWRNIRMTREISYLYGLRPGLTGSLILMRSVAEGMVAAGVGELVTHSAADALGDALAGAALAGAGQAASNALFTARTGLQTMKQCRPIPFMEHQKPGLREIRHALKAALPSSQPKETETRKF